jgi:penicillin-binding protein 1A
MLHGVIAHGTANNARIGQWAAGKTGTTQSYRDAWFVGFSGDLVTAVWVGHRAAQVPMTSVHGIRLTGGSFPAKIWAGYMGPAVGVEAKTAASRSAGSSRVRVTLCTETMLLANLRCPKTIELYLDPADVPKKICTVH